jgi:hypothetical protein
MNKLQWTTEEPEDTDMDATDAYGNAVMFCTPGKDSFLRRKYPHGWVSYEPALREGEDPQELAQAMVDAVRAWRSR